MNHRETFTSTSERYTGYVLKAYNTSTQVASGKRTNWRAETLNG